uniref:Uncharacterized protein n=1 Tax=Anguilla anguilla TaxID=7936 RepID=A0A0E9QZT6_ANGAN
MLGPLLQSLCQTPRKTAGYTGQLLQRQCLILK